MQLPGHLGTRSKIKDERVYEDAEYILKRATFFSLLPGILIVSGQKAIHLSVFTIRPSCFVHDSDLSFALIFPLSLVLSKTEILTTPVTALFLHFLLSLSLSPSLSLSGVTLLK